jgi:hypothetical protein
MIPRIQSALNGWESNIRLTKISQTIIDGDVSEAETIFSFKGVIQPLKSQDLALKPLDTRSWLWYMIHTKKDLEINVGDNIMYEGQDFKVMNKNNYKLNGYFEYHIVEKFS